MSSERFRARCGRAAHGGVWLGAALLAACADAPSGPGTPAVGVSALAARRGADGVSAAEFARQLGIVADDSMRGRGTPSRELELTAAYIAATFSAVGLTPGGDAGTYVRRYTLSAFAADPTATAPNVIGILEGSDPLLRAEHVLVTSHMDAVGMAGGGQNCVASGADSVCNGANDNGSGTVAVLQLARAFAGLPTRPRRTLVFATFSGEERGLWGSLAYARAPALPLPQTAAAINIDMIGRNATDSLFVVGKTYSTLGDAVERVNRAHPETGMRFVNDAWDGLYFGRSDHYSFARLGVPSLFFFNGPHGDVHTARDALNLMNVDAAARSVRMIFYAIVDVADAPTRPSWDPAARTRWVVPLGR